MRGGRFVYLGLCASVGAALWASGACSATARDQQAPGEGGGGGATSASATTAESGAGGRVESTGSWADFGGGVPAEEGPSPDEDGDGFTIEDCDGVIDNAPPGCDRNIAPADFDAIHGAHAIDLCAKASPGDRKWGVLSAQYVRGDGSPAEPSPAVGVLDSFGPNVRPQGGTRLLVLSSGRARIAGWPGACNADSCENYGPGDAPPGFPQGPPECAPSGNIHDDIALELVIRAPTNATGYEFAFKFYTFEYPEFVGEEHCFNDQFVARVARRQPLVR
jgi:hypothetical protein